MSEPNEFIPIAKPLLDSREATASARAILSGWVTQGPLVADFEKIFSDFTGAPYACAVSSCTTALHIAFLALGIGAGDEVITVSHSFIATANSIRYSDAKPVFIDITPETFNINPSLIEQAITKKTKAILCVHQIGMPCDLEKIIEIAKKHSLKVIEDAACAIGSEINYKGTWSKIGAPHGDIACFSFHPRKVITTGDGGMLTTRDEKLDKKFRLLRQHGMAVPDTKRHNAKEVIFETYDILGYNYRMTDIQAAMGIEQVKRLPEIINKRREIAERYLAALNGIKKIILPKEPAWAKTNWQSFCVRVPGLAQKPIMQYMLDQGIATRRGVMCAHLEEPYKQTSACIINGNLYQSELAQKEGIIIPLYPQMTRKEEERVLSVFKSAINSTQKEKKINCSANIK
ncbi:spore coat polysaccharide biosynthesis protein SpsC [Candidatus Omnitrophus magneticus]|uniref:GDP-perosamine synthase n=1 Tax=Candidatus Omnitrophus magneticus TaxID=1609969 RepID=A0A0F0CM91_9BACT|nr:spore coat polysaccharide biosynthesis protein SpsC [Candidatus Omnitrophus magneticus]